MPKNVINPIHILTSGDMSQSTLSSDIINVQYLDNVGLEVTWTGTPTGTITVEGSVSNSNYYSLTFNPTLTQPAGSSGGYLINLNQFPFVYYYVKYTRSSGTGTLNVWAAVKEV